MDRIRAGRSRDEGRPSSRLLEQRAYEAKPGADASRWCSRSPVCCLRGRSELSLSRSIAASSAAERRSNTRWPDVFAPRARCCPRRRSWCAPSGSTAASSTTRATAFRCSSRMVASSPMNRAGVRLMEVDDVHAFSQRPWVRALEPERRAGERGAGRRGPRGRRPVPGVLSHRARDAEVVGRAGHADSRRGRHASPSCCRSRATSPNRSAPRKSATSCSIESVRRAPRPSAPCR